MEMTPEAAAARRQYYRRYRETHRDEIKRQQIRYWQKRAETATAEELAPGQGIDSTELNTTNST